MPNPLFVATSIVWMLGGLAAIPARADWPARVFAPYMYLGAEDKFKLTDCDDACGQKFFTLAFIVADKRKNPAWDGFPSNEKNVYADQIAAIRGRGGDVIVSFGGAGGRELALVQSDPVALQAAYQNVIDRYKLTWLDFDIEGKALLKSDVNARRNIALARLQSKNAALRISYTLAVDPDGLPKSGLELLNDAKARGVNVYSANVMTMDFGPYHSKGKRMSDVAIASALKAREQCQAIDPAIQIGITPMIGQNDEKGEIFTQEDAAALEKWTAGQTWVCSLSFWSVNRDTEIHVDKASNKGSGIKQKRWEFTRIFQAFTSAFEQPAPTNKH